VAKQEAYQGVEQYLAIDLILDRATAISMLRLQFHHYLLLLQHLLNENN